jgi:NAD(P)-dependent dehydrogenase (short-subunit alcohol dehydrogenase family)
MDLGLTGKGCVVTGASRGIGLATAKALTGEGARVLLVARSEEPLAAAVEEVGGESAALTLDVTERDAGDRVLAEAEQVFGGLDVLVSNAGTSRARPLDELTDEEWDEQWQLHVMASMRLMRAAAPRMAERGWGRIVNVASSSGKRPSLTNAAYSVTKTAQLALSRVFADTYAAKGVLVNAVTPGPVATPLWMGEGGLADQAAERQGVSRDDALESQRAKVPLGRFGEPEEIAAVIAFLCSERASDVAGSSWSVDGGIVPLFI